MEVFNIEKELELLGYEPQDKQEECLATRNSIAIYYAVNDGENYDSEGHPIGMIIEDLSTLPTKKLYEGKMPTCKQELIEILTDTRVLIK